MYHVIYANPITHATHVNRDQKCTCTCLHVPQLTFFGTLSKFSFSLDNNDLANALLCLSLFLNKINEPSSFCTCVALHITIRACI